jgi:hypothetical protein
VTPFLQGSCGAPRIPSRPPVLIALELFAYGWLIAPRPKLLLAFAIPSFILGMIGVGLASLIGYNLTAKHAFWFAVLISWFLLSNVLLFPFRWKTKLLPMIRTYSELESWGAVSSRRVREVAVKAAEKGVVWPGPLFAILDDNIARGGVLPPAR